jgi:hypothetical protein
VVQRACEASVEGGGATRERLVGGALACGSAALAAFSGALIILETEMAIAPVLVTALGAWSSKPGVVRAAMVAIRAGRHTAER